MRISSLRGHARRRRGRRSRRSPPATWQLMHPRQFGDPTWEVQFVLMTRYSAIDWLAINSQLGQTGLQMTTNWRHAALDVDLLARELGNWRTSSRSGPAYQGLADGSAHADRRRAAARSAPACPASARWPTRCGSRAPPSPPPMRNWATDGYLQRPPRGAQHDRPAPSRPPCRTEPAPADGQPGRRRPGRPGERGAGGVRRGGPRVDALSARHRPSTCVGVPRCAQAIAERYCAAWPSHRARRDHGDHRRAARDRSDPDHLHPARRPRARRTAHLSRCARRRSRPPGRGRCRSR